MKNIYKLTIGMYKDAGNETSYIEEIKIKTDNNLNISVPIYGIFEDDKLIEIITRTEIPIVLEKSAPGFGAYAISPVYSIEDYYDASFFLKVCNKSKQEFKITLDETIKKLNKYKSEYNLSHMDKYGLLSQYNPKRKENIEKDINANIALIEKITTSNKNIKK